MMSNVKIYMIARGIGVLFVCLFFSNLLVPEFVGQYYLFVILFFAFLVGGFMYYLHLQKKLKKELALEEEKLKLRQEKLQNELTETMKELVILQSKIRDYDQKIDRKEKNGPNVP